VASCWIFYMNYALKQF